MPGKNDSYPTKIGREEYIALNWEALAELFDTTVEDLKEIQREGIDCPECGEHLEIVGHAIQHDCSRT